MAATISFGSRPAGPAVGIFVSVDPSTAALALDEVLPLRNTPVPREFFLPDNFPPGEHIEGFWYDLRSRGVSIYRGAAPDPLDPIAELMTEDGFSRVARNTTSRKIRVVVSQAHAEAADSLRIYSSALARASGRPLNDPIDEVPGPFR